MTTDYATIGAVGIIFIFAIREFFLYLRSRKFGNGSTEVLQKIQGNDLQHISKSIEEQNVILQHHAELLIKIATLLELQVRK